MKSATNQMIIRIDPKLKATFDRFARQEGKSTSQLVRDLMTRYIQDHDMSYYIDDLWERTGTALKAKGVTPTSLEKIIKETRKDHDKSRD